MREYAGIFPVVCVIPSLNPDEKFLDTVRGIFATGFTDLIVVDDGSREACQRYFETVSALPGCTVLRHMANCGKGRALKTAFMYYLEQFDLSVYAGVVTADADGQHLPEDIMKCAQALIRQQKNTLSSCMVLGTRDFNKEIVPFKSRNGNKITSRVFQMLYGKMIHDTQTGLRALSNDFVVHCNDISGERFEYEIKMLIDAVAHKIQIIEESIQTVYFDSNRETHFRPIQDSVRIYRLILGNFLKFATSGLFCFIIDQGLFALLQKVLFSSLLATTSIPLATGLARAVSSFVNYSINRSVVFQSASHGKSLPRYYLLCIGQAAVSAGLVTAMHELTQIDASFWKLIVDTCLFFVSYRIQRAWVFREERI